MTDARSIVPTDDERKPASTFVVTLTARPGTDGIHALRAFLKLALRRFGLKCINLEERA